MHVGTVVTEEDHVDGDFLAQGRLPAGLQMTEMGRSVAALIRRSGRRGRDGQAGGQRHEGDQRSKQMTLHEHPPGEDITSHWRDEPIS